jgi:hypothetical protein
MANALDLLNPTVRDLRADEALDERQAMNVSGLTPDQLGAYMAYKGGRGIAAGAGQMAGGALGVDVRSEDQKYTDSIQKVKDQIVAEGLDPTSDSYYPRVIQLLAQNRLPTQAAAMQQEYQKMKTENARSALGLKREERMAQTDLNRDARAKERNATIAAKLSGASRDKVLQYMDELENTNSPEKRTYLTQILNNLAQGKLTFKDAGGEIVVYNPDGSITGTRTKTVSATDRMRDTTTREITDAKLDAKESGAATDAGLKGPAKTGVQSNEGLMANIRAAYDKLKAYPNAIGFSNYGDFFDRVDRMDPKGVTVRAAVANLGSQLIHDRSGAAVSVLEMDRLRPFVPARTDSFAVAVNKLAGMYDGAVAVTNAIREANGVPPVQYPDMPNYDPHYRQDAPKPEATPRRRLTDKPAPAAAPAAAAAAPAAAGAEVRMLMPPDKNGKRVEMMVVAEDVAEAERSNWTRVK